MNEDVRVTALFTDAIELRLPVLDTCIVPGLVRCYELARIVSSVISHIMHAYRLPRRLCILQFFEKLIGAVVVVTMSKQLPKVGRLSPACFGVHAAVHGG